MDYTNYVCKNQQRTGEHSGNGGSSVAILNIAAMALRLYALIKVIEMQNTQRMVETL